MLLQEISLSEQEKWDSIVKSFNRYEPFYLYHYCSAMSKIEKAKPILLYMEDKDVRAMTVIFERSIPDSIDHKEFTAQEDYRDISSPYGYGGLVVEGEKRRRSEAEKLYINYCKKKKYISEFVRFNLFSGYETFFEGQVETLTKNIICDLAEDIEKIWMNFEHKVRKNVNRAQKNNLELLIDRKGEYLKEFLVTYYSTMERNQAQNKFYFPREFFEEINKMAGNHVYFHVRNNDKIISTELVLLGNKAGYSFLGGTDSLFFAERPNDFLKFGVIKWLKAHGFSSFVLGGGYGADDGIFKYKRSFAPNGVVPFHIGKRIFDTKKYDFLCEQRKSRNVVGNFFPEYRV